MIKYDNSIEMKRIIIFILFCGIAPTLCTHAWSQTDAKTILEKTAEVLTSKGGASASFKMSGAQMGDVEGTLNIKSNKFRAITPQIKIWFDGTTQWTYIVQTNEVNVIEPTKAQQQLLNPYSLINIYKDGYDLDVKSESNSYTVHLTSQSATKPMKEIYITVGKTSYAPSKIRIKEKQNWITITISNFKAESQSDNTFKFNEKDYPTAEIVDLR